MEKFDKTWSSILDAADSKQEQIAIRQMSQLINSNNGSLTLFALTKEGQRINVITTPFTHKVDTIYEITVYWDDNLFTGKGWLPKDEHNVSQFLLE